MDTSTRSQCNHKYSCTWYRQACLTDSVRGAIDLALRELHVPSIDLLIVSFPSIPFDADDEGDIGSDRKLDDVATGNDTNIDSRNNHAPDSFPPDDCNDGSAEDISTLISAWRTLESLPIGVLRCLGVAEFGTPRLMPSPASRGPDQHPIFVA